MTKLRLAFALAAVSVAFAAPPTALAQGMTKPDAMAKPDAMKKPDAMAKPDAMKKPDAMAKPDAMKKDGMSDGMKK